MLALYATDRNWLALSRPHFPLAAAVVGTVGWEAFEALAPGAECSLVAVPPDAPPSFFNGLHAFARRWPYMPLVLIAERTLPSSVGRLGVVVAPPLLLKQLWPAIQQACMDGLFREAAGRCASAGHLRPLARRALCVAVATSPPLRSLTELAHAVASSPRTVAGAWNRSGRCIPPAIPLADVLDWLLLLRAITARLHAQGWDDVAHRFGIHRHTLARVARDLAQSPLRPLGADTAPGVRAKFRLAVLDTIVPLDPAIPNSVPIAGRHPE